MKPNYQKAQMQIESMRHDWQDVMGLNWMSIDHKYLETYNDSDHLIVADTETLWQYRTATVRWFLPAVVKLDYEEIQETLIHEYTHILLAPIENNIKEKHTDLAEFTVEGIARAIKKVRER